MSPAPSREEVALGEGSDRLLCWGLALLAFALPLVLLPGCTDFYTIPKTLLFHVVVLGGLLRVAGPGRSDETRIAVTPLSLPLLAILGVGLVSLIGSRFPWAGVEAAWRLWNGILLYHLAVLVFSFAPARRPFLVAMGLSILPVALYGILQMMGIDFMHLSMPRVPVSSLGNTGYVAEYLVAALPIALALAVKEGKSYLFAACVILGTIHLWLTESRAGWLGAALGLGILILSPRSILRGGEAQVRLRRLGLAILLLVLALALLAPDLGTSSLARLRSIADPTQATARVRLLIWRSALELVAQHPVLGVGLGNFEFAYAEVRCGYRPIVNAQITPW
jgi:O-antigen ligase